MWFTDIVSKAGQYAWGQANAAYVMLVDALGAPLTTNNGALATFETAAIGYDPSTGRTPVEQTNNAYTVGFINGTAAQTVKAAAGFLHSISITPVGALGTNTHLAIYDNTAGSGVLLHAIALPPVGTTASHQLDVLFTTGLTLAMATFTAGNAGPTAAPLASAATVFVEASYR